MARHDHPAPYLLCSTYADQATTISSIKGFGKTHPAEDALRRQVRQAHRPGPIQGKR
jgi:hypothetical protein